MPTKSKTPKPATLCRHQYGTLVALRKHGSWNFKSEWIWCARHITEKALQALVKKGYAAVNVDGALAVYTPVDCALPTIAPTKLAEWTKAAKAKQKRMKRRAS